jgi:archaellum component FlaC
LDKITNAVLELSKAVDDKIGQLQAKYDEVTKSLADLNNAATEIATRVESVEEETAMKKSGELENSIPEQPVMRKSLWGGRFLSSADLFN